MVGLFLPSELRGSGGGAIRGGDEGGSGGGGGAIPPTFFPILVGFLRNIRTYCIEF